MTECPCENCEERKLYAAQLDLHFYGADCPYDCPEYAEWKKRQEVEQDD